MISSLSSRLAASCDQLAAASHNREYLFRNETSMVAATGGGGDDQRQPAAGQLAGFKRLTLPVISSRTPSLIDDDDADDQTTATGRKSSASSTRSRSSSSSRHVAEDGEELDDEGARRTRSTSRHSHSNALFPACQQQAPDCINLVAHQLGFVTRVSRLFSDKRLMVAVFAIVWTTFNSELQYTSFIIINLEVGEDVYLNYILGGCMEALAAVSASLLLSYAPRRQSLIVFWLLISVFCFGLSVAHIDSTWAVWLLALAKFSQSSLSSIASVAAYESFPTELRQSGSGLVFTLGMLGSVFAPLIFAEFDDQVGMDRVLMTFSLSSLVAATLIYLYLTETRDCELQ